MVGGFTRWSWRGGRVIGVESSAAIHGVVGMPFRWAFNPYRGCTHACRYCYARVTHEYLGYNSGQDFERLILAKVNAPQLLEGELSRPRWGREVVAVGTATDPYQPVEGLLRLTRRCLDVFLRHRTPVSLVTKSTLVVRDARLLAQLSAVTGQTRVWVTVTTLDPALARSVEPGAPAPAQRLRAVSWLRQAGVPVGVLVAPVLPGLTDDEEQLGALVQAAWQAGAQDVAFNTLRLCPGAREVYQQWLQRRYPNLVGLYRRLFGRGQYPPPEYRSWLHRTAVALRASCRLGAAGSGQEDLEDVGEGGARPGRLVQASLGLGG